MAMLVLPDVFERTWGIPSQPFWPKWRPGACRSGPPTSASWPRSTGISSGRCSSRASTTRTTSGCTTGSATGTPGRCASTSARAWITKTSWRAFLENHDEPRAAVTFPPGVHEGAARDHLPRAGAAVLPEEADRGPHDTRLAPPLPGARQARQPEPGAVLRQAPCRSQIAHRPGRRRRWQLLECKAAWDGNWTWDGFVAFAWQGQGGEWMVVAVNYVDNQGQCHVPLPFADLGGKTLAALRDLLGPATYDRDGDGLVTQGLFLDMRPMRVITPSRSCSFARSGSAEFGPLSCSVNARRRKRSWASYRGLSREHRCWRGALVAVWMIGAIYFDVCGGANWGRWVAWPGPLA